MKNLLSILVILVASISFAQDTTRIKLEDPEVKESRPILTFDPINPEYPGGYSALSKFIKSEMKYPQQAIDEKEEGKVFVEFKVTKTGKITDVKVVRGVSNVLDAEALRIVSKMPDWKPGIQNGEKVNCYFTIPINFILP